MLEICHGLRHVTTHHRDDTPYGYTQKASHNLPGRHGSYEKDLVPKPLSKGSYDWSPSVTKPRRKRLTILSARDLTVTRWSGWLPWSSSDRRRTCSSQDPREPGKASWLPHWDTRHANPEYGLSMRAPRNSWDS